MIVMINGAFGAGKTTQAENLARLIPNSMIVDPELSGYLLRELIPDSMRQEHERSGDFSRFGLVESARGGGHEAGQVKV